MGSIVELGWNLKRLFKQYQQWQTAHSFDLLVL